jgi:hypothetical protein
MLPALLHCQFWKLHATAVTHVNNATHTSTSICALTRFYTFLASSCCTAITSSFKLFCCL